jgi:hypothetical protein
MKHLLLVAAPFLLLGVALAGGQPVHADEVTLAGGSSLEGLVLEEDEAGYRLLLPGGDELQLARADVATVRRPDDAPARGQHLRYVAPATGVPGGLDLAVTSWIDPAGGARVDLVGAVHMADPSFYRAVQRRLDRVDVTLFEAVIPEGTTLRQLEAQAAAPASEPLRALQTRMATWLGLTFQLEGVDYTRPHFVHADVTAEELAALTGATEGALEVPASLRMALKLMDVVGPLLDRLMGDTTKAGPLRQQLKRQMAAALGTLDAQTALAGLGAQMQEVLLHKRNAVVLVRLQEVRRQAAVHSIAVFYGAAHMAGLEEGLAGLGYVRANAEWLRAWHVE